MKLDSLYNENPSLSTKQDLQKPRGSAQGAGITPRRGKRGGCQKDDVWLWNQHLRSKCSEIGSIHERGLPTGEVSRAFIHGNWVSPALQNSTNLWDRQEECDLGSLNWLPGQFRRFQQVESHIEK